MSIESPQYISKEKAKGIESAIEELEEPIKFILMKMKPNLEKGDFEVIIGDDASGRLPTLIIGAVIKKVNSYLGFRLPSVRFFAGKGEERKAKKIKEFMEENNIRPSPTKKILVVTDFIATGSSLYPIIEALREQEIKFDIASIGELSEKHSEAGEENFFSGNKRIEPEIYGKGEMSGVVKDRDRLFSVRSEDYHKEEYRDEIRESVTLSRQEAVNLSDRLAEWIIPKLNK